MIRFIGRKLPGPVSMAGAMATGGADGSAFSGASVRLTTAFAPNLTVIEWEAADYDTDGYWPGAGADASKLVVPEDGWYEAVFNFVGFAEVSAAQNIGCWAQMIYVETVGANRIFNHEFLLSADDHLQQEGFGVVSTPVQCVAGGYWYLDLSVHSGPGDALNAYGGNADDLVTRMSLRKLA